MKKIAGDIIILHICTKNHNHMMYGSWDKDWGKQKILSFWSLFCPLTTHTLPLMIPKIQILKKMKKMPGDIILLYIHTIYQHMIYCSWNIKCDRQKLTFWAIFRPFSPLTTWKIIILTLKKIPGDINILHICTMHHIMLSEIWSMIDIIFCHSGLVFPLLPHLWTQKIKILKKWKKDLKILSLTNMNDSHIMYSFSDMECTGQNFLSFWTIFCPPHPPDNPKIKILKNWKNQLEMLSFYICVP